MAPNYSSLHQQLIAAIVAAAPKLARSAQREFIAQFYASSTVDDLKLLAPKRAVAIALTAEKFFAQRDMSGPKISIQQAKYEEDGRSLTRTQIFTLNADMPFLVDSLSGLMTSLGLTIHRILHPILPTARDSKGALQKPTKDVSNESLIYIELSPLPAEISTTSLGMKIRHTLHQVATSVADWKAMRERVQALAHEYANQNKPDLLEVRDLLQWLSENHFVFLGLADYRAKGERLQLDTSSALGLYRLESQTTPTPIERSSHATTTDHVSVLKASEFSHVHRHVPMDFIVLRRHDAKGKFLGEIRILGLFTSIVYYRETTNIPFIRRKAASVIKRAGFSEAGHSGKTLKTALEFLPRDELFQMDDERLFQTIMGIVALDAKPQVKLFLRTDPFERFVSAMVYVPRERYSTELRSEIVRLLERAYQGTLATFYTQITDAPLARLHIHIATQSGQIPQVDEALLEQEIAGRASLWADALRDAVIANLGEENGEQLAQSFARAFPLSYLNSYSAQAATLDIQRAVECLRGDGLALELLKPEGTPDTILYLKCYTRDLTSELSQIIPLLEHMGATVIDATPYVITPLAPLQPLLLRNFTLRVAGSASFNLTENKARIEDAIAQVWRGFADNDTLNALVFSAGLTARDVEILRAYSRYLQQLDFPYSQSFIASALNAHAPLASKLVALFHARFNPTQKNRDVLCAHLQQELEAALEQVTNLGEDRIIRRFLALILASLRTNFYQQENGAPKSYLSIKFRSNLVPEMALPVPYAEIFVTSRRMEGIHLRGGPVARGGLRWSDRPEDFRTEVLGLMKTQMVKNAVIVPVGSKGGFILRKAPTERDALQVEGIACYQMFLRGMLDLTDNIVDKKIITPPNIVRYDADDPYLVVAADKGTASFSDIANGISAEYDFWLGDAFASGGSVGYDHKEIAITARGGWVSVERHFREMDHDMQTTPFTTIGIGDMSGDVFGNGMLLSRQIQLVAAFNHKHIFIDPTPDPASSFTERERLFHLPRSGWNDYHSALITKGGGVFERSAKSIKLTAEMRQLLGTDVMQATPDELIRLILKAPVDLLWNGGIGTYVKAAAESHEQVGDRANNAVRIDARELRCKVVGEGGNLGFTQRGRIEYARHGGRINTDAIDNSGGVDCSDHEVNIKIALSSAVSAKRISLPKRNALLKKMTDEVAHLVLIDNKLQTQAISIAQAQGTQLLEPAGQLMLQLEADKFLNRQVEALPNVKQLAELRSAKLGLTRPEIAVLMAYAKMAFFRDLSTSPLLDSPYFEADLLRYFPKAMRADFSGDMKSHRLRREIVATMVTNSIVNRTGFSFAHSVMHATGLGAADIAQAYIITRDAFHLRELWADIEALDGKVNAALQSQLFAHVNQFIDQSCRWFLQHIAQPMHMNEVMKLYAASIVEVEENAETLMTDTLRKAYDGTVVDLVKQAIPAPLAARMAKLEILASACDIADVARVSKLPIATVGKIYFELGARLKLGWLRRSARELVADNYWQQLAAKSLNVEFYQAQRRLCLDVIARFGKSKLDAASAWEASAESSLGRYQQFITELRTQPSIDYPMLIVALRQVQSVIAA